MGLVVLGVAALTRSSLAHTSGKMKFDVDARPRFESFPSLSRRCDGLNANFRPCGFQAGEHYVR